VDSQDALRHSYSARLVRPFVSALRKHPGFPTQVLDPLAAMDPDERLPIPAMLELMRGAIEITKDPDLGLKAAREIEVGDYGALEYAAASASTVREAQETLSRYTSLVNDALTSTLSVENGRAVIRFQSAVPLPRASSDFQAAAFYVASRARKAVVKYPPTTISFVHERPENVREYEITFPGEEVLFGQSYDGMSFDAAFLDEKLVSADAKLHGVIRDHAENLLAELPKVQSFSESVRVLITRELSRGDPSASHIAELLGMSSRTLARRLEDEGTTFKELVEELRRGLSLRYVGAKDLDIGEVAFLLGFSDTSSFYRAFKRWTGQTPLAYRRGQRG
jgi:AraC-like DNA-binding protein